MNPIKSPFKFLDSFTKEDKEIFFGRDKETEELYHKIFESKILLVYGVSGTGKSSLINCGLVSKFSESDWLPVNVRRGGNIVESMARSLSSAALTPLTLNTEKTSWLKKGIRSLYLDHFKPIFIVFDQFEELFIFGSKSEKEEFIKVLNSVIESDLQCRFLFVIREEYLASITEFEKHIPSFLANRVRIEKMTRLNAQQAIEGPCKFAGIEVEENFSNQLLYRLSPEGAEIELTYLQVYLDKIFREAVGSQQSAGGRRQSAVSKPVSLSGVEDKGGEKSAVGIRLTLQNLESIGDVKDLLGSFLEEQIAELSDPDTALVVLKAFVSTKGTKRQVTEDDVLEYSRTLGKDIKKETLRELILRFISLRILRDKDESARYELRHDALASKIYEKITLVEKELMEIRQFIENAYDNYQRRNILLSKADLSYIAPYEDKIYLKQELKDLITKSKFYFEKVKRRKRSIFIAAASIIIVAAVWFGYSSYQNMKAAELQAKIEKSKSIAKSSLSLDDKDPSLAYLLAEYAYKLYPTVEAESAILNSYKNAPFCTKIICDQYVVSPDKKWIAAVSASDNIIRIYNYKGVLQAKCIGHNGHIEYNSMRFSIDSKYLFSNSISDNTYKIWNLKGQQIFSFNGEAFTHLEIFNNEIIVLEKNKFSVFDFSGKKNKEILFNSQWTSFKFKDELLAIVTKDLKAKVYNLKTAKIISEKTLDYRYEIAGFSDNKEVLHLYRIRNNAFNESYNTIWNFKNNFSMNFNIDTTHQVFNFLHIYNNTIFESVVTNNGTNYNILNLNGKEIVKIPKGYIIYENSTMDDLIIFSNYNLQTYIVYNLKSNLLSSVYSGNPSRIRNHTIILMGDKKGDIKEFKAIDLDKNIIIGQIEINTSELSSYFIIDIIPSLKVFMYCNKNNSVFVSYKNKVITYKHDFLAQYKTLLNENYYLQDIYNDDHSGIKSCLISKIDTNQFSAFNLSVNYKVVGIDSVYSDVGLEILKRIEGPAFLTMGYSPDEKYIIVSDKKTNKTTLWSRQGKIIKEIPFLSASYKFSKSGKYLALNSFNPDVDDIIKGEFRLYKFPEFKLLYSEPCTVAGVDFIEKGDTLCVLYAGNSMKYINNKYQKKNEWKLDYHLSQFVSYSRSYDWLSLKENYLLLLNTTIYGNYFNRKVEVYDYLKRDTLVLFEEDSCMMVNFYPYWTHTLFTNNRNVIINLKKSIQINDIRNNNIFNLKNKGDMMYQEPYNDSVLLVVYLFANESRMVRPETPDTFQIMYRRTPNYFIETWDIYNNKMIYKKRMNGSCENFSFYKERMLMNNASNYLYTDLKCNKIIEFTGNGMRSDISPQGNYFVYLDDDNKRLVSFPLNPNEIIKRVRVDKEFGELRQLIEEEKQEYGIDE